MPVGSIDDDAEVLYWVVDPQRTAEAISFLWTGRLRGGNAGHPAGGRARWEAQCRGVGRIARAVPDYGVSIQIRMPTSMQQVETVRY